MPRRSPHALRATRDRRGRVEALGRRLERVGLDGVLADLDRVAHPCPVPEEAAGEGFAWEPRDQGDRRWWPQGVASTRAGEVLLVSWYAERRRSGLTPGSRISVVDRSDPARPRYRHVLLVAPRWRLGRTLGAVPVHAGGIAVHAGLLYVADTLTGVRVFDLDDVLRVPRRTGRLDRATLGRRPTGGYTAHGYEHVLPQRLALRVPLVRGTGRLRFSFVSVGRLDGQLSLVAGEYRRAGSSPRLVRYPLDEATGLPEAGRGGRSAPVEVHDGQPPRMQGVAVAGSTWWVSASAGEGRPGDLHVGAPGAFRRHRGVLPTGPEDLDWSRPGEELWCATEWPGRRLLFPVDAARWASA